MKCYLPFLLLLCVFCNTHAQTTNYADRMNHIFGAIDKTKVTTGYLKEFGIRFNNVESYNGVLSDSNLVDVTQWKSLYNSLYSMRVGAVATSMLAPTTAFANLNNQQAVAAGTILLAAQHYKYQQYKTTAYTGGDVTVVNDRIFDVAGRNPYKTKTVFAVAPMKTHIEGNTFSFKLQSNMVYTNSNLTLNTIEIDFGNGQGYQPISLNTAKNVSCTTGGEYNDYCSLYNL